jgi:heterodisulfide reductase subunit C2
MTTTAVTPTPVADPELAAAIAVGTGYDASVCMNCGVCTAVCPLGLEALPRKVFHYASLGLREKVLEQTEAVYSCLLCRMCESSCPAGVHITANVRALRHYLNHTELGL